MADLRDAKDCKTWVILWFNHYRDHPSVKPLRLILGLDKVNSLLDITSERSGDCSMLNESKGYIIKALHALNTGKLITF